MRAAYAYTQSYHAAINHLIQHGVWGGNPQAGRDLCARALRDLRRTKGRASAQHERYHMRQICGCFPVSRREIAADSVLIGVRRRHQSLARVDESSIPDAFPAILALRRRMQP